MLGIGDSGPLGSASIRPGPETPVSFQALDPPGTEQPPVEPEDPFRPFTAFVTASCPFQCHLDRCLHPVTKQIVHWLAPLLTCGATIVCGLPRGAWPAPGRARRLREEGEGGANEVSPSMGRLGSVGPAALRSPAASGAVQKTGCGVVTMTRTVTATSCDTYSTVNIVAVRAGQIIATTAVTAKHGPLITQIMPTASSDLGRFGGRALIVYG